VFIVVTNRIERDAKRRGIVVIVALTCVDRLVLIVSIVAEGEKTNKSSSLPGVNKIEEKIEKVLKSPKHLLYFQTKIKFVKGPPPERAMRKNIKTKTVFCDQNTKKPFKEKIFKGGGHKFADMML